MWCWLPELQKGTTLSEFQLNMKIDNDAFVDNRDGEIASILREIATKMDDNVSAGIIRDVNGARIGTYGIKIDGVMP